MKFYNGKALMSDDRFEEVLSSARGRFDLYQAAAEYAVFHYCEHGDKTKLERFFKAFLGVSGKIIGDGAKIQQYVNKYCYGFTIKPDARVLAELKKNRKPKPRGFKGRNDSGDLSWKVGGHRLGFADSITAWMKAEESAKQEKKAEAERKAAEAEAAKAESKAADAESKAAEAESKAADAESERESDDSGPKYTRTSDIAESLRTMREAFQSGVSHDVVGLEEAIEEANKLSALLADRKAEAEAEPAEAPEPAEAEEENTEVA